MEKLTQQRNTARDKVFKLADEYNQRRKSTPQQLEEHEKAFQELARIQEELYPLEERLEALEKSLKK